MSQLSLNLIAITVFTMTMTSLLGPLVHLSPVVPAIATAGALGLATLDTFSWRGQGVALLLDWLASFSPAHRDRILRHEAGHFLIAYQSEIPITGYALNAWEALRQGHPGFGGVRFGTTELEQQLQQGALSKQLIDRYCTVWMAGIAAETLVYGNVEGGDSDRQQLRAALTKLGLSVKEVLTQERLALLRAKTLLQEHWSAYEALVSQLAERVSVEEAVATLAQPISEPSLNQVE